MGEYGRRKGNDFEQSIAAVLTYLGFKIVLELDQVKCVNQSHRDHPEKEEEHSIDLLAQHDNKMPRPGKSFDGLTFFDCTAREKFPENQFRKVSQTLECLRESEAFGGIKGAIVATSSRMTPQLQQELEKFPNIMCWDIGYLSLYGALASLLIQARRWKNPIKAYTRLNDHTVLCLRQPVYTFPHQTFEGDLVCEHEPRLGQDALRAALQQIKSVVPRYCTTYLRVHSLNGFTPDLPRVLKTITRESRSRLRDFVILPEDLFDYTRPWFADSPIK